MPTNVPTAGSSTIDDVVCTSWTWRKFNAKLTAREGGGKLFENVILNGFANVSVPGPLNHLELVEAIARTSEPVIPIARLSPALNSMKLPRGRIIFGFPGYCFDEIARNYQHVIWWVSKSGLVMDAVHGEISELDDFVGRRLLNAPRLPNGRFAEGILLQLAKDLDRRGCRPLTITRGTCRLALSDWNQKHPRKAIHTFELSLKCEVRGVRSAVKKSFYRALAKFEKAYPKLSRESAN